MKILFVSDTWHPQINGASRVTQKHAEELQKMGHTVEVIHPGLFRTMPILVSPDIRLALFPGRVVYRRLQKGGFDAVHIPAEGPLGWAARRACCKLGIPFTTWYHTRFDFYLGYFAPFLMPPLTALLRRFHSRASRTMVSTENLRRHLEANGFKNLVVVPLGVDVDLFVRNSSVPTLPGPVFMYFGRLAPEKSPQEFLKLKLPGTKLVIGDGPLRAMLQRRYGDAMFVGFKRGQELVDWISRADVFVFPSRTETFGLVVLEALACGVPVAAHDEMGPRDIITPGVDGYLSEDLADAAQKCLALSREACRQTALQYSWARSAQEFLANLALTHKEPGA